MRMIDQFLKTNMSEKPLITLTLVFMGMFSIMAIFEIIRLDFLPGPWQSPFVTILVAGIGAAFIAFFPLRALRHAESRFKAIFDNVQNGIVIIDAATHQIVNVNPVAAGLIGLPKEKIVGEMCNTFLCPNDPGKCPIADLHQTLDNSERVLLNANGEIIPIIKTVAPAKFLGKPYFIESIADNTKRKKIEAALNDSEARYRNIVQDQTEFICRFRPDGTHIFTNDAYCRYFNKDCSEFLGKRFRSKIPPEDQPKVKAFFAALTPDNPTGSIEHRIIMPDGEVRWQSWSERGIFDNNGAVVEYQSVGRDITPLKEAEAKLKKNDILMRAILRGSPGIQFVIDTNHRVIFWNRVSEIYTGVNESDIVGTNDHWRAFYEEERPTLADILVDGTIEKIPGLYSVRIWKSVLLEGAYEAISYFPKMRGGSWLYFTAISLHDEQGTLLGAVETAIDITALHKAEAEVKASHERYLSFIKEAAMRLKTPVEVVGENLSEILDEIRVGETPSEQIILQLNLQVKNLDQIRYNIINLNKTIIEGFGEISEESKKFLTE